MKQTGVSVCFVYSASSAFFNLPDAGVRKMPSLNLAPVNLPVGGYVVMFN
jgi:hypothetical protein